MCSQDTGKKRSMWRAESVDEPERVNDADQRSTRRLRRRKGAERLSVDTDNIWGDSDSSQAEVTSPRRTFATQDTESSTEAPKMKRAPGAPKRFRSAFILFSIWKHDELRKERGEAKPKKKMDCAARWVAAEWQKLSKEERSIWVEKSKHDKERFMREKSNYKGPWKVEAKSKPNPAHYSNAPKKPQPAFLAYSNSKRAAVKRENPSASNGEISRKLAKMWREAPDEVRRKHTEAASQKLQQYHKDLAAWRASLPHPQEVGEEKDEDNDTADLQASSSARADEKISSKDNLTISKRQDKSTIRSQRAKRRRQRTRHDSNMNVGGSRHGELRQDAAADKVKVQLSPEKSKAASIQPNLHESSPVSFETVPLLSGWLSRPVVEIDQSVSGTGHLSDLSNDGALLHSPSQHLAEPRNEDCSHAALTAHVSMESLIDPFSDEDSDFVPQLNWSNQQEREATPASIRANESQQRFLDDSLSDYNDETLSAVESIEGIEDEEFFET